MRISRAGSLLGLAQKAGKIASGEFSTEKAVKAGQAFLVVLSDDASENTKKKFRNMAEWYEVPFITYADKTNLGHFVGKGERSSLAVLDENFAANIEKQIKQERSV